MKYEYESILTVRDEKGDLIGMFVNDIAKRKILILSCAELGLDEIKDLFSTNSLSTPK